MPIKAGRIFEFAVSSVLALSAVAIAWTVVRREFGSAASAQPREIVEVKDWHHVMSIGRVAGDPTAPVKIIEFADFECPFCKRYHATLKAIRQAYPEDVAIVLVHFPLSNHRFAMPAAIAAECAQPQGRFWDVVDVLYAKQDSLGILPWSQFGAQAGVRDTIDYSSCLRDSLPRIPVQEGAAFARRLGLDGTPTILVNGWRFPSPPNESQLKSAIAAVKAGKKPVLR